MDVTPILADHEVIPMWTLPDKYGQPLNLAKQRGRAHMLLLVFESGVDGATYLRGLAAATPEWTRLPARVIVIASDADSAGALGALPFTIAIDEDNLVRRRYLPGGAVAGVFALDRYGELYHQWLVVDVTQLPSPDELDGWMQAISMQCSV